MNHKMPMRSQQGIALMLALLLLFVMVVLGVAGFSTTQMQERGAGNVRLQAKAFERASAGANDAINFFDDHHDLGPDQLCGSIGHIGWDGPTDWVNRGAIDDVFLQQRMYCLAVKYPCTAAEEAAGVCTQDDRPVRSQLFVHSRGYVTDNGEFDGEIVAQRDVEVRLAVGSTGGAGDGCGAMCFPACSTKTLNFPNSNDFTVDGSGGPAITAGCQSVADSIRSALGSNPKGNYIGGIAATTPGAPWDSPAKTEQFRQNLELAAQLAQSAGNCQTGCYYPSGLNISGGGKSTNIFGTPDHPQITYVEGNASFGGNVSGAGILVVNGNLSWNGTPNFKGLILVLGGSFNIDGGGHGGDHGGSVILLNNLGAVGDQFGPASFSNTGGGRANYTFSCSALWAAHDLLDGAGQGMWSPECDTAPQNPYEATPDELIIASWRENIGWREATFAE